MTIKTRFGILSLTTFLLLLLVDFPPDATGLPQSAQFRLHTLALAQTSDPATPEPLILTDEQGQYPLGLHLEILEDPGGELTIEDVSSPEFDSQFVPSQVEVLNYGFTDNVYWLRLRLDNQTRQTGEWLLEQGFANTHYVDLYTPLPDGEGFSVEQTGILRPVSTRDVLHPRIIFDIEIHPDSQQTYYLRLQSGASMTLPLTLWTQDAFLDRALVEQTLMGIFYGVLIGLLFSNLFLFFTLREVNYLFFVILLASLIFEEASYSGYLLIYVIPDLNVPIQYIEPVALPLLMGSMVLFADSFLELKSRLPKLHATSLVILTVWGTLMLLIPFTSYRFMASLMAPWSMISLLAILIAGIVSWLGGYRPSRFFLLAWLGLVLSVLWVFLVRLGLASSTLLSENAFRIGYLWMVVCWSIALADRINLLKADTESANRDLRISEHRLSQILEGLPLGVVVYGKDQKPNYVNQRAVEILRDPDRGIQPDISVGRSLEQAIKYYSLKVSGSDELYPFENFPVFSALRGEPATVEDVEIDRGDKRIQLEIMASPVRDDSGNVESAVAAFQDITSRKQAEKAQHISEARFRVIAENNFDGIAFMGSDRKVLYVSPSYQRLVGRTAEDMIGESGVGFVHPDDRDYTAKKFNEVLKQPNARITAEYRIPHKEGSWIWVETFAINMLDDPGVQAVVLNSHDITDRKQAEAELAEYRKNLETLVERRTTELVAVNVWLNAINQAHQTVSGMEDLPQVDEGLSRTILQIFDAGMVCILRWDDQGEQPVVRCSFPLDNPSPDLVESLKSVFQTSSPLRQEIGLGEIVQLSADQLVSLPMQECFQKDGLQALILAPMIIRQAVVGVLGVAWRAPLQDIGPQYISLIEEMALDLANLAQDAFLLDQALSLATAEERNRLARELHDSVVQTLFTSSVLAEATPRIWDKDRDIARQNMEKLSVLIRGALAEMRSLLLELHSGELQNQTLSQLLATLAEAGRVRTRAVISISITGDRKLPDKVTLAFYRIAQEALNNAINHAQADQINIALLAGSDTIEMRIQDDGSGFDPRTISEGHLGISIMAERAAQVGADLQLHSEPSRGTEIILTWSGK